MTPRKKSEPAEPAVAKPKRKTASRAKKPAVATAATDSSSQPQLVSETGVTAVAEGGEALQESPAGGEGTLPEGYSGRIVVFSLEGQKYAIPIEHVQEIQQLVAYTDVPDPMPALVGMVNLRGVVVPLVDLRSLLGMEQHPYGLDTPMIICRSHDALVAVAVDEVDDVVELPPGCVQPPSRLQALSERMLGVCRMDPDLVFLLDLDAVVPETAGGYR